ncbi:MAG: LacI family DNA-binding transcriptional regulator [bacterium]|nr:LacI family DNA-binding transcriptional regulator [bacterium]
MGKSVKLSDIARELGVSTVTVSNALAGRKGVSEELRISIEEKAKEMGYIKSVTSSKTLQKNESYNIGVIVSERYLGGRTSFYWELYQKLVRVASKKGSFTMLEVVTVEQEQELNMPALIKESKIDGLAVIGRLHKEYLQELADGITVPMIFIDFYEESVQCDSVVSDNFYGMYRMTKCLIKSGHKEIAFVGNIFATSSIMDRYLGYQKAILESGNKQDPSWLISDRDLEQGKMKIQLPERMPSAFVCNCDLAAELLIEELSEKGYEVPKDISIVGYDNFTYSSFISKNLTTYDVDTYRLAKESFHILSKKIKNPDLPYGMHMVEGAMLIRNSVKELSH